MLCCRGSNFPFQLNNVKYILYNNAHLWIPFDQQTYELNKLYAEMAGLAVNKISVYGASYAKKPIFATVSRRINGIRSNTASLNVVVTLNFLATLPSFILFCRSPLWFPLPFRLLKS